MIYDVYTGGFHVVQATLDVDLSRAGRYSLELSAHTRGFLGKLAPWEGTFETHGWHDAKTGLNRPEIHKSTTTWEDELEIKEYEYGKDGTFRAYRLTDEYNDGKEKPVAPELTSQTTDALTGVLDVMQVLAVGGACEGASEVFDGKRRYRMVFKDQGPVDLKASKYNVYGGPAAQCIVEVEPLAGEWHSKPRGWMSIQEQGRARGTMPTVWMARLSEGEPYVPVRIMVKTEFGALVMHLVDYRNGPTRLALADEM